jgi:flagellar hook-length control protein FliK
LVAQSGLQDTEGETQDLLAILANLIEQLQQQEQEDSDLTPETQEQLADMLAAFQALLEQMKTTQTAADPSLTAETPETTQTFAAMPGVETAKPVVKHLREVLQQLSEAIVSGTEVPEQTAALVAQLKARVEGAGTHTLNAGSAHADEIEQGKSASKAEKGAEPGAAVSKEAQSQTAASSAQETRRATQPLRDPVWRFQIGTNAETASANVQSGGTAVVASGESTSSSQAQPAWTFLQNDTLANAESASAKAQLPSPVPVQQFADQLSKFLVKQFQFTQGNGTTEAKLSLTPEHLGHVDIRIIMNNGIVTAQFISDNPAARDLLENQMSQLRTALNVQGLQVEKLEVVQQSPSSEGTSLMQQENRNSNSGNGNGANGNRGGEGLEDSAVFAAELERNSSLKEIGFGSSINVTA